MNMSGNFVLVHTHHEAAAGFTRYERQQYTLIVLLVLLYVTI